MLFSQLTLAILSASTIVAVPLSSLETSSVSLHKRFSGRATYYEVGLGACGETNTNDQPIIAMNIHQYTNSACGKWVQITYNGKSARGYIKDMCPSCEHGALDLSPSLFEKFGPLSEGVLTVSWDFAGGSKRSVLEPGVVAVDDPEVYFDPAMELRAEDLLSENEQPELI